jgi:putative ABC transport system ATP-binding protein
VALLGESGVGKSTLLNCIAGLDRPTAGSVLIDRRGRWRGWTTTRGTPAPAEPGLRLPGLPRAAAPDRGPEREPAAAPAGPPDEARVAAMLDAVGLAGLGARYPAQLSGGQLQRVAIARAVVHAPGLILADEPTGNLDPATAERVLDVLRAQVRDAGAACLLVTHSVGSSRGQCRPGAAPHRTGHRGRRGLPRPPPPSGSHAHDEPRPAAGC